MTDSTGVPAEVAVHIATVQHTFHYWIPGSLGVPRVGDRVRVRLGPRRVTGWVVDLASAPPPGIELAHALRLQASTTPEMVDLARWAAWRWAGGWSQFLSAADRAPQAVSAVEYRRVPQVQRDPELDSMARSWDGGGRTVVTVPPAMQSAVAVAPFVEGYRSLVVAPTRADSQRIIQHLRQLGISARAAEMHWRGQLGTGEVLVGTRSAVWNSSVGFERFVVVDEHDEQLVNQSAPTWSAREVLWERGRRSGVPVIACSPVPSPEARRHSEVMTVSRHARRAGWAPLETVSRRDMPYVGSISPRLGQVAHRGKVVCVVNRLGRARLLLCRQCSTVSRCERCDGPLREAAEDARLTCQRCGLTQPCVCAQCGSTAMLRRRLGLSRVREELEAVLNEPVGEFAHGQRLGPQDSRVVVGTTAALRSGQGADLVAFVDFDSDLMSPRFRAAQDALAMLMLASRMVGGSEGRVLVQTTMPDHAVIDAARRGDSSAVAAEDVLVREMLKLPPAGTVVTIRGPSAVEMATAVAGNTATVLAEEQDRAVLYTTDRRQLYDALHTYGRPAGVVVRVDPYSV